MIAGAIAATIGMALLAAGCSDDGGAAVTGSFNSSQGIAANGFWDGVTASELVTPFTYDGLEIPADVHTVSDEELDAAIESLMAGFATTTQVTDRAVVDGDTVNIDFVGSVDGVPFEGGSTEGAGTEVTIGVTEYIPGFLEQLLGHRPGETFDINVTFPADYHVAELQSADSVFEITLNFISESTTPELTDAWVAENLQAEYGWATVAQLREGGRAMIRDGAVRNYVEEFLMTQTTVSSIPASVRTWQTAAMMDYYRQMADQSGVTLEVFITNFLGVANEAAVIESNAAAIDEGARYALAIQAVAEWAGIEVTEADVAAFVLAQTGSTDVETFATQFGMPYLKQLALTEKVVQHLVDNAKLV